MKSAQLIQLLGSLLFVQMASGSSDIPQPSPSPPKCNISLLGAINISPDKPSSAWKPVPNVYFNGDAVLTDGSFAMYDGVKYSFESPSTGDRNTIEYSYQCGGFIKGKDKSKIPKNCSIWIKNSSFSDSGYRCECENAGCNLALPFKHPVPSSEYSCKNPPVKTENDCLNDLTKSFQAAGCSPLDGDCKAAEEGKKWQCQVQSKNCILLSSLGPDNTCPARYSKLDTFPKNYNGKKDFTWIPVCASNSILGNGEKGNQPQGNH